MDLIRSPQELQVHADTQRAAGQRIALVPTMGALHAGHLSLVEVAKQHADRVWVSIFVNPTQFNESSDFEAYPREDARDLEVCKAAGVDLVYMPAVESLYPHGAQTWVEVEELASPLCGATRPGHFRGVTTVVSKLLLAAKPHVAVFGEKDYQQLAILKRLVRDLGFDVEVIAGPTVREEDGLALSSRNVHLGPKARGQATALVRALELAGQLLAAGETDRAHLLEAVRRAVAGANLAEIDYVELRDPETLEPAPRQLSGRVLLALALRFRGDPDGRGAPVRLIDNRVFAVPADVSEPRVGLSTSRLEALEGTL